ncbi:MAG: RDD family protein [Sinobacteraceae bacterium]|nr:RDD family protein [Nevskiaceae bacterium]
MSWYVRTGDREIGPISEEALGAMAATGQLGPDALVWRRGMTGWVPAADASGILPPPDCDTHSVYTAPPWRRFWARWLDVILGTFLIGVVITALRPSLYDGLLAQHETLFGLLLFPCALLGDALVYAVFGNTPGKAIAGIQVVADRTGERLTFLNYLKRNFELYIFGLGLGVPLFNLFLQIANYRRATRGEWSPWDVSAESQVIARSTGPMRAWITGVTCCVVFITLWTLGRVQERRAVERQLDASVPSTPSGPEHELQSFASDINREGPRMVTPDTRFDDARAGPGLIFTYDYTMTSLRRSDLSEQQLEQFQTSVRRRLHNGACGRTRLAAMLRVATLLRAHYLDQDGSELGTVEVSRADCL